MGRITINHYTDTVVGHMNIAIHPDNGSSFTIDVNRNPFLEVKDASFDLVTGEDDGFIQNEDYKCM